MSPSFSEEYSIPHQQTYSQFLGIRANRIMNCTPLNNLPFSSFGDFESAAATEL
jgi:hypothetical protein